MQGSWRRGDVSTSAEGNAFGDDGALALLCGIPDAVFGVDEGGTIVFANRAGEALAGRQACLLGAAIADLIPSWPSLFAGSGKSAQVGADFRRVDGAMLPVELSFTSWPQQGRVLTGVIVRSVLDHKVSEAMLEEAEAQAAQALAEAKVAQRRLREIIEMLPQGVCVFDAEDRYVLWNQHYANLYPEIAHLLAPGIPFAEILRASLASGQVREKIEDPAVWLERRLLNLAMPSHQEERELNDGRWLRYDDRRMADGGAIGMRIDITDLKRREASFRLLFEGNPVPLLLFDAETLRIREVNHAAIGLYGFSHGEFLAKTVPELHIEGEAGEAAATYASVVDAYDGRKVWHQRSADGSDLHVLLFIRALVHEQRRGLLVAVADVGDRVRAEAQISNLAHCDALTGLALLAAGIGLASVIWGRTLSFRPAAGRSVSRT